MRDLNELFLEQLADIYAAEKQLIKALPKMAEAAASSELQTASGSERRGGRRSSKAARAK